MWKLLLRKYSRTNHFTKLCKYYCIWWVADDAQNDRQFGLLNPPGCLTQPRPSAASLVVPLGPQGWLEELCPLELVLWILHTYLHTDLFFWLSFRLITNPEVVGVFVYFFYLEKFCIKGFWWFKDYLNVKLFFLAELWPGSRCFPSGDSCSCGWWRW